MEVVDVDDNRTSPEAVCTMDDLSIIEENNVLKKEKAELHFQIRELIKDCEVMWKKSLVLRNEQNVGNAEYSYISSNLTATEHYHNNLHNAAHSTTQYVKNGLLQLQRFLQKSSDFKENKDDLLDVPDIEFSFSTLRNNDSMLDTFDFSNISQIHQTFHDESTIHEKVEQFETAQLKNKINEIEAKFKEKCIENKELQSKLSTLEKKDEFTSRYNNPLCLATIDQSLLVDSNESFHSQDLVSIPPLDRFNISNNCLETIREDIECSENNLSLHEKSQNLNDSQVSLFNELDNTLKNSVSLEEVHLLQKELQLKSQEIEELSAKLADFDHLKQSHDNLIKEIEHLSSESIMHSTLNRFNISFENNEVEELKYRLKKMEDHLQTKHSQNEELLADFNSLKEVHEKLLKEIEHLSSDTSMQCNLSKTFENNTDSLQMHGKNVRMLDYLQEENNRLLSILKDNDCKLTELNNEIGEMKNKHQGKHEENENLRAQLLDFDSLKEAHGKLLQEIQILSSKSLIRSNSNVNNEKISNVCDTTFETEFKTLAEILDENQSASQENKILLAKLSELNNMKENYEKLIKQHEQLTMEFAQSNKKVIDTIDSAVVDEITELKSIVSELENDLQLKCQQNEELNNKLKQFDLLQEDNKKLHREINEMSYELANDDFDFKLTELQIALSETEKELENKQEENNNLLNNLNNLQHRYDEMIKELALVSSKSATDADKESLILQLKNEINDLNKNLEVKHEEIEILTKFNTNQLEELKSKRKEIDMLRQSSDEVKNIKDFCCEIFNEVSTENFTFDILKTYLKSVSEKAVIDRIENETLLQKLVEMDKIKTNLTKENATLTEDFDKLSTELMESLEFGESQMKKLENLLAAGTKAYTELENITDEQKKFEAFLECIRKHDNTDILKSEILLLQKNIQNLEDEKNNYLQMDSKCKEFIQTIAELKEKDMNNINEINMLRKQISDLKISIDSLKNEISTFENENFELKDQINAAENNVIDLQNKIVCQEKINSKIENLKELLKISQNTIVSLENENTELLNLKENHSQLIESLNETSKKLEGAQSQITSLNEQIADLKNKDSANCTEKQELMNELKTLDCKFNDKKADCKQLEEQLKVYKNLNEELEVNIENKLKTLSEKETEKNVLETQKTKLCKDIKNLGTILQNVQLEIEAIDKCKSDVLRIEDQNHFDDEFMKPLVGNIFGILKQMEVLHQCKLENVALIEELEKLKLTNEEKNAEIKKLQSVTNMLELRNDDLQSELNLIMKNSPRARRDLHSKRRSLHDSYRKVSLSPIPNDDEKETHNVVNDELKSKLEALEAKYNNLQTEHDKIAKSLDEKIEETVNLIKVNRNLKINLKLLQKKKQMSDAQTNTEADITPPLMSLFVDKMTHNAEKEKNKQLQNQIEDLRSKNRELSDQIRRLNLSLQNNTVQSLLPSNRQNSDESSAIKIKELETIVLKKDECIKELEVKCKELDDECDKCQMVMEENRDGYNSMYEELKVLQQKYEDQRLELEKLKNLSIESVKKKSLAESRRVPLSPKTENASNRENMEIDNISQHSSFRDRRSAQQCLKFGTPNNEFDSIEMAVESTDVAAMKKQYTFLQMQIVDLQQKLQVQSNYQMSCGIVQQQRFGEYYTANQKLYSENLKLRKLCHKYATQIKENAKSDK